MTYYGEEGTGQTEGAHHRDEDMNPMMLVAREERVVTLYAAPVDPFVPAVLVVRRHQGALAGARHVELQRRQLALQAHKYLIIKTIMAETTVFNLACYVA